MASPSPAAPVGAGRAWPAGAVAFLAGSLLTLLVLGVAPWELAGTRIEGAFHDGHVWAFEHVAHMLTGQEPLSGVTTRVGYPGPVLARFIGWFPALLAAPLQAVLGPLGAYNTVLVASPGLAALATFLLLRRRVALAPWVAAGLCLSYALCPYAMGCLSSGQVAKLQHWLLPALLLAASHAVRGPSRLLGLLACLVVGVVTAFTTPSTALFMPMAAGLWVLSECWDAGTTERAWRPRLRALPWALGALAALAAGLAPARWYYGDLRRAALLLVFEPRTPSEGLGVFPLPMAQPEGLLLGLGGMGHSPEVASHVCYLGLPLLVLGLLVLALRKGGPRLAGLGLLLAGVVLALGPLLVSQGEYVLWNERRMRLPAALLEALGYPTKESGMYYRAALLASLGLTVMVARAWTGRLGWLALALAWLVGLGQVADGWRATRSLWPAAHGPQPGEQALLAMAADPLEGAVLDLPLEAGTVEGGVYLLASTEHRRPTTGLLRRSRRETEPRVSRLCRHLDRALAAGDPARGKAILAERGFRYLTWRPWLDGRDRLPELERAFGEPLGSERLYYWPLESAGSSE